ncbi:MAG: hypothetical protein KDD67_06575 [Ignavibacteriae bacterium]|nr:hypothetical protein [Ignavibacteriota bacterium]MCB9215601.1 hypothetical protein [Ignavibacteria bacterium]
MTNRQPARPGNLLLNLVTQLIVGVGVSSIVTSIAFALISFFFGDFRPNDAGEVASLLFMGVLLTTLYSIPLVLLLVVVGDYIDRRVLAIPSKGMGFVLIIGGLGLGFALLSAYLLVESFSFDFQQQVIRNAMISAAIGGGSAGTVIAYRIGGKR